MKGFTKDGKFHPITEYKGVRKSRDQTAKTKGVKIRKLRIEHLQADSEYWWDHMEFLDRKRLIAQYEPKMVKDNYFFSYDQLNMQIQNWIQETFRSKNRSAFETGDEQDSGEIPPEEIYDKDRLTVHDGRYFLVAEGYPDTLAVDEYQKLKNDLFKHVGTVYFAQDKEDWEETLRMTGGGGKSKYSGVYELQNEKKFLDGLDRAGGLDG